ncbi:hypothetical protein Pedsa_2927 [Pseudopedobacter saltans DSM 12145]|uniref:Sortase n=1 Tax=Pseudopedobacter saltans (strain ATCC 51119 / DSM 12145 / JCM 21818 / CCUG 39354 / LMG 10337 / NBRC 100064 / NCIMB 13643) TaxID=762903 RepID=F0S8X9_PSESL|nr:DUF6358 family protein [Pseudopedobacter saltans]ADY53466.1 hypothetical protein Pedsa_2927 [Pseudopedobacter saltans DSM 12145]
MGKKVAFNVILNLLIIFSVIVGVKAYQLGNYFVPILCAASFSMCLYYKLKLMKDVRKEMKEKADSNLKNKNNTSQKK